MNLTHSCSSDPALSLAIPQEGFEVVQHQPAQSTLRQQNCLYQPARAITQKEMGSAELLTLIDSLYAVMLQKAGVGIAANQLGKRLQIFIVEAEADNPRYQVLGAVPKQVFVNPRITKVSEGRSNFWHGCLSAHNEKRGNVATYNWIEYACYAPDGRPLSGRLEGFAAVIFQHEFRHLLGGTYLDQAEHLLSKAELDSKIEAGILPFFESAPDTLPLLIEGYRIGESLEEYYERNGVN